MIRRKVLDEIGWLDERYFLYVEDIDFCLRAHQAGWEVYYVPEAAITHYHIAISDRRLFSKYMYYHYLSMFYYFMKHKLPRGLGIVRLFGERLVDSLTPQRNASHNERG
jgi:GT2 family glycosyltransferase